MFFRVIKALPYFVILAISVTLFLQSSPQLRATGSNGIGPTIWPNAILIMMMVVCGYEVVKRLIAKSELDEADAVLESVVEESGEKAADPERSGVKEKLYPHLLWLGIGLSLAYVALIESLGFFTNTIIFLAMFMWIGRYRRPVVIVAVSLLGSLTFSFIFMKVVYVSLPLGQGPFRQLSILLMQLMGVR